MKQAMDRGRWVFFQNCHLSPSWMPSLERLIEQIDGDKVCSGLINTVHSNEFNVIIPQNFAKCCFVPYGNNFYNLTA